LRVIIADVARSAPDQGRSTGRRNDGGRRSGDGREAVELALHYRPDVIVMEVVMPALDGILAPRKQRENRCGWLED
jgi:CheY-like chemotaxis protein